MHNLDKVYLVKPDISFQFSHTVLASHIQLQDVQMSMYLCTCCSCTQCSSELSCIVVQVVVHCLLFLGQFLLGGSVSTACYQTWLPSVSSAREEQSV